MSRYAISWGAGVIRKHRVVRMPDWLARFIGRHLWRILGKYHSVQIEEGVFPTSPIPTAEAPVKRQPDVLSYLHDGRLIYASPRIHRQAAIGRDGAYGGLLIEGSRTNLCLWSHR